MLNEMKIAAGIVTYNRKVLLIECLNAVLNQSFPVDKIILVDNASTDGTYEELSENGFLDNPKIMYIKMEKNTGGSGGFHRVFSEALSVDCDWIWIMDDDTIPARNCLKALIEAEDILNAERSEFDLDGNKVSEMHSPNQKRPISFLASSVFGEKGEFMNVPNINYTPSTNGYPYWYEMLKFNMVNIKAATFVSLLVNKKAVQQCGLPCKDYFIWGDDTEYTNRITRYFGDAFLVGSSIAIHKRVGAKVLDLKSEKIKMYHYFYRNNNINSRYYDKSNVLILLIKGLAQTRHFVFHPMAFRKIFAIIRGYSEAIFQYKKFKKYIDTELNNGKANI